MSFRISSHGPLTVLLVTTLAACSSKTTLELKDAGAGRDTPAVDLMDTRGSDLSAPDLAGPDADTRSDDLSAPDLAGPDANADLPNFADVTPLEVPRFDTADTSVADVSNVPDALADRALNADGLAERPISSDGARGDLVNDVAIDQAAERPDSPSKDAMDVATADAGPDVPGLDGGAVPGGACTAGQVDTRACGSSVGACVPGTQTRTCAPNGLWAIWSDCGGTYVGPSAEICGDAVDNNCNGAVDEGCGCNPAAPGSPISFKVSDGVSKLVSDPTACLMYGLRGSLASKLVVFDTAQKKELTTVDLGGTGYDFDLSPDGSWLVASIDKTIKVIDKTSWTAAPVATVGTPGSLVVANGGMAYYMEWSSPYDGVHRIDLKLGLASDARLGGPYVNEGGLELSPAGDLLFMGEAASTGCNLYSVHPLVSPVTTVSKTTWDNGNGFGAPSGHVYLGPSGKHVYYADHQFDASDLGRVLGKALYVFAEDSAARFAVSEYGILDAELLTTLVPIPNQIEAAAFTSADTELWTYDISAGQITCTNVADLAAGKTIGVREAAAGAIGDYTFAKLVADPDPSAPVRVGRQEASRGFHR